MAMLNEQQRKKMAQQMIQAYIASCRCTGKEDIKQAVAMLQYMVNDCAASMDEGRAILIGVDMSKMPTTH